MKIILLLSFISFSSLSFATEELSKADVLMAINMSFEKKNLNCRHIPNGVMITKSTDLDLSHLLDDSVQMNIDENKQPAITFLNTEVNSEYVLKITTNLDLTIVKNIHAIKFEVNKNKINIGTITNPKFKYEIISKTKVDEFECK